MHRRVQLFERREQALEAVGQLDGRGGIGEHGSGDDEQHQAQHHEDGKPDALDADVQELPLENVGARCIEQVEHRCENDDEQDRLEAAQHHFRRNARNTDDNRQKCDDERIRNRALRQKQQHDECHGQYNFYARVEAVYGTVSGEKLTECNILQHQCVPSFRL